jgi:hypothetical protein
VDGAICRQKYQEAMKLFFAIFSMNLFLLLLFKGHYLIEFASCHNQFMARQFLAETARSILGKAATVPIACLPPF